MEVDLIGGIGIILCIITLLYNFINMVKIQNGKH